MSKLDCCSLTRAIMTQLRNSGEFDPDNDYEKVQVVRNDEENNRPINVTINITINKNGKEDN